MSPKKSPRWISGKFLTGEDDKNCDKVNYVFLWLFEVWIQFQKNMTRGEGCNENVDSAIPRLAYTTFWMQMQTA